MTMYDQAVDLQLRLGAAQAADMSAEFREAGQRIVEELNATTGYMRAARQQATSAGIAAKPNVDPAPAKRAVGSFRGALSRSGEAAFQHKPADDLVKAAKRQREGIERWLKSQWKATFGAADALLAQAEEHDLPIRARSRAQSLRTAMALDPVVDSARISQALGVDGDMAAWMRAIARMVEEFNNALATASAEHEALPAEVKDFLRRSGSTDGFPLDELSADLLTLVQSKDLHVRLVVRRR